MRSTPQPEESLQEVVYERSLQNTYSTPLFITFL